MKTSNAQSFSIQLELAKEKEETAVVKMTAEERAASIRSLLDKVKLEDDGQEESQG